MTLPTAIVSRPIVDLSHHRIHEGTFSSINVIRTGLTVANPKYFLILNPPPQPDGTIIITHMITPVTVIPGAAYEIFEDAIVSNNGTPIPLRSNNRNAPFIDPTGFTFENPTIVSEGTRIFSQIIGSPTVGGIGGTTNRDEEEIIMKIGSRYLFKISPLIDGVTATFRFSAYSNRNTGSPVPPPPV